MNNVKNRTVRLVFICVFILSAIFGAATAVFAYDSDPGVAEAQGAIVSISGPALAANGFGETVKYTISATNMPLTSGIELEIAIDPNVLNLIPIMTKIDSPKFSFFGSGNYGTRLFWKDDGDKFIGKVTLINTEGVKNDIDNPTVEILNMEFEVKEGSFSETTVSIHSIQMSYAGSYVPVHIGIGEVITSFYSKYDIDRNGVVDFYDITKALTYFMAKEGDSDWASARVADVNNDGVVNVLDMILVLANYTDPFYQ